MLTTTADIELQTNVRWMARYRVKGMVIWPRIMFAMPAEEISEVLFRHELEHAYQIVRMGRWRFYLKYFWYSLRYSYDRNPLEVEAFERQYNELTPDEELLLCNLRHDCAKSPNGSRLKSKLSISLRKSAT